MFDALTELEGAVAKLLVTEESVDVGRVYRLRTQLEAVWLRAVEAYDRSGEWQTEFGSTASALRARCNVSRGTARNEVTLARKLAELPVVFEALADASITRRHAASCGGDCGGVYAGAGGCVAGIGAGVGRCGEGGDAARDG